MTASVSQIGPREVLTRIALGFISPISRLPTRPRLRSLSTRCTERMSERRNSSSFSTRSTPCAAAFSAVRFWLQAIAFMLKASPTRATALAHRGDDFGVGERAHDIVLVGERETLDRDLDATVLDRRPVRHLERDALIIIQNAEPHCWPPCPRMLKDVIARGAKQSRAAAN